VRSRPAQNGGAGSWIHSRVRVAEGEAQRGQDNEPTMREGLRRSMWISAEEVGGNVTPLRGKCKQILIWSMPAEQRCDTSAMAVARVRWHGRRHVARSPDRAGLWVVVNWPLC
jgi:hypothetical protein